MSNNPLVNLPYPIFKSSFHLTLFYVVNVNLKDIDSHRLHNLEIELIMIDDYYLCCISTSDTLCPTNKPWYICCSDILPKQNMKALYISVSVILMLLNFTSN